MRDCEDDLLALMMWMDDKGLWRVPVITWWEILSHYQCLQVLQVGERCVERFRVAIPPCTAETGRECSPLRQYHL
jgi:hypothetical protein